jgi:hypothetical protein
MKSKQITRMGGSVIMLRIDDELVGEVLKQKHLAKRFLRSDQVMRPIAAKELVS